MASSFLSGWVDISGKCGQFVSLKHDLNATDVVVDITGKQSSTVTYGGLERRRVYGGASHDVARRVIQTCDGGYAIAGYTASYGFGGYDFYLVKTDVEIGLTRAGLTNTTVTLYRGKNDLYWNYVRVRIWIIKEPSWIYGDINMDGIVDAKDLYILSRNYGKILSLLSLTGIVAIGSIHTVKKRKQPKKVSYIS